MKRKERKNEKEEKISLAQRKEGWRIGEEKMDGTGEGERRRREKGGRESDEQRISDRTKEKRNEERGVCIRKESGEKSEKK